MKLEPAQKTKCEMGGCKNKAVFTIKMNRIGIKSRINICLTCLKELYTAIGAEVVPKSIETIRKY